MKIYRISQNVNNDYDTYDSAIVCAENEEEARKIHPDKDLDFDYPECSKDKKLDRDYGTWTKKRFVKVEYLGEAKENTTRGVLLASFNAG